MKIKLILHLLVFAVSSVFIFVSMPIFDIGGFTKTELTTLGIVFLCNTVSVVALLRHLRVKIKEGEKKIEQINKQIARNEAKQRALLREMNDIRPRLMRPEIRDRLPSRSKK